MNVFFIVHNYSVEDVFEFVVQRVYLTVIGAILYIVMFVQVLYANCHLILINNKSF